jgi:2',3'-cyclic-nucleotide 2'-phosphodiesterase (5'-nucleotidase family)
MMPEEVREKDGGLVSRGGESYVSSVISRARSEASPNCLLLDAGDLAQGSPVSDATRGSSMVEIMNREGYDATVVGNHDLEWGIKPLEDMASQASFPFLAANMSDARSGRDISGIQPYVIKELNGLKVGIVGVTTPEIRDITTSDDVRNLSISSPEESLQRTIPRMKRDGADLVVVLSHNGLDRDRELASRVKGIDVIVGGHSHLETEKPVKVGDTLIVQAGSRGARVGRLDIEIDPSSKKILGARGRLILVDQTRVAPDPEIEGIVEKYSGRIGSEFSEDLGLTNVDLSGSNRGESGMGDFLTDVMRRRTGADIALLNSGGIRSNFLAGRISGSDVYNAIPFENRLVTVNLTGDDLKALLEQSAVQDSEVLQFSGMKVVMDSSRPAGERVVSVTTGEGEPLQPDKVYTVATIDYLARRGGHFQVFKNSRNIKYDAPLYDIVKDSIRSLGTIEPAISGRLQDLGKTSQK